RIDGQAWRTRRIVGPMAVKVRGNRLSLRRKRRRSGKRIEGSSAGGRNFQRGQQAGHRVLADAQRVALSGAIDPADVAAFTIEAQTLLDSIDEGECLRSRGP